jgi:PST family polysaccharide transporter
MYRIAKLGLSFLITAWVARYLGAEQYGTYIYAVGLAELCMLFWGQGLKEIVIHETKKAEDDNTAISATSFQLMAVGNIILYGLLALILFLFIDSQVIITISLVCGIGIWFRSFEAYELWFHANLKVRLSVRVQFVAQFLYMASNIMLIFLQAPLVWFGVTYAAQLMVAGIGFLVLYVFQNEELSFFSNNWSLSKKMITYGKFMILAKLVLISSFLVDRFLIEYLLNLQAVGVYTAATKMTTTWTFVASSISLSYIAVITESVNKELRNQNMNSMFGWITLCAILLVIPFYFFSDELVSLLFGDGFKSSAEVFSILLWSLPFLLMSEGVKAWLVITGETKYYMYATGLTIIMIVVGNVILVPVYGLNGAAYTFIISWIFGGSLSFLFFKKTRELGIATLKSFLFPYRLIRQFFYK